MFGSIMDNLVSLARPIVNQGKDLCSIGVAVRKNVLESLTSPNTTKHVEV